MDLVLRLVMTPTALQDHEMQLKAQEKASEWILSNYHFQVNSGELNSNLHYMETINHFANILYIPILMLYVYILIHWSV